MKKRIIAGILVIAMTGAALSGCGNKTVDQPEDENIVVETEGEEEKAENSSVQPESQDEDTEEGTEEDTEDSAPKEGDWFEEQGLTITPQGDFKSIYSLHDDTGAVFKTIEVADYVTCRTRTVGDNENDYKVIELRMVQSPEAFNEFMMKATNECENAGFVLSYGYPTVFCLDRNNGKALAVTDGSDWSELDEKLKEEGLHGEAVCLISYRQDGVEARLYCPLDYDGGVFVVQNRQEGDSQMVAELYEALLDTDYVIGDGPEVGPLLHEGDAFFSLENE